MVCHQNLEARPQCNPAFGGMEVLEKGGRLVSKISGPISSHQPKDNPAMVDEPLTAAMADAWDVEQ